MRTSVLEEVVVKCSTVSRAFELERFLQYHLMTDYI